MRSGPSPAPAPVADTAALNRFVDGPVLLVTALAAAAAPSLLALNVSPSPTFLNQALALALWGWLVAALAASSQPVIAAHRVARRGAAPLAALALLLGAAALAWWRGLPAGLALSHAGLIAAAALLLFSGAAAACRADAPAVFAKLAWGFVLCGLLNAVVAALQVFAPGWADADWVAHSGLAGRAVGNLRQPNHLSSLLLWAAIAVVPLLPRTRPRWLLEAAMAVLVGAVVLTASRTGLLGVGLLALWGLLDRRLGGRSRALLLATPLVYALAWWGMALWAQASQHTFGGEARLAEADLSGSRFGIWRNTLSLIAQQPWAGVGLGEFNFAWTLTPFPGRPVAFFDHSHNLPLQLAVELGLPLATLVMGLLLWALWQAWRRGAALDADALPAQRAAWMLVLLIGVHSLLEYPLWYAYFLLPAAWAWGYALGVENEAPVRAAPRRHAAHGLFLPAALLVAGSVFSLADYLRVAAIFSTPADNTPLHERIAQGQRSVFFAHHADYAAATAWEPGPQAYAAFDRATHYLLDARLMQAWAQALQAHGEQAKARHLAQRLHEFRNAQSQAFFAECELQPQAFQCDFDAPVLPWREFLPR